MSTFSVNDSVIHCREGLSTIIGNRQMNGKDYFLVRVNRNSGETFYVPVESAENIIRAIMSIKEADLILKYIKSLDKEFNSNTKHRRDAYKRRLSSGDVKDIAYLYRQLYFYDEMGGDENSEIKLGPVDIDMLSYARDMLLDELTITYQQKRENIAQYIEKRIASL